MGYISELRKYVGHSPIMATSIMCIIYDREKGILFEKSADFGVWCVPGGALEIGESLEEGLKREVKEETGVEIEIIDLLGICDHIVPNEEVHWVSPSYLCKITKGEPTIMEPTKHADMKWFSLEQLPQNLTITTKNALKCYLKYKK